MNLWPLLREITPSLSEPSLSLSGNCRAKFLKSFKNFQKCDPAFATKKVWPGIASGFVVSRPTLKALANRASNSDESGFDNKVHVMRNDDVATTRACAEGRQSI